MNEYYPKALVFFQFLLIGLMVVFSKGLFSSIVAMTIFIVGMAIGVWALSHNKLGNFNIQPKLKEGSSLITTGVYKYVRHPMYLSVIITMFAFLVSTLTLTESSLFIALVVVLQLKAKREEALWIEKEREYLNYQKRTKRFIPFLF